MIILEADLRWGGFGRFRSTVGGKRYRRWWFGFLAVTYFAGDQKEFGDAIRSGTEWRDK